MKEQELVQTLREALYVLDRLAFPKNSAVIFDIDDTLIAEPNGRRIEPVCKFYNSVLQRGIKTVLITARPAYERTIQWTKCQLQDADITGYDSIYFRDPSEQDIPEYKKSSRKNVWERGINVVMSVGDMWWDVGEYGGIPVLVA